MLHANISLRVMHLAKRRRLDESASVLSKPFRSPLRVDSKSQNQPTIHSAHTESVQTSELTDADNNCSLPQPTEIPPQSSTTPAPIRRQTALTSSSPDSSRYDPVYLSLQKEHSALLLQLSKLRQSLDVAQQAVKIQSSNQDAELEVLIAKWKLVSREAAEEIFRGAKERVNRMGGVGAWREKSRQRPQGWDEDEAADQEDLTEEQKEQIEIQREEMQAEIDKYGLHKKEEAVEKEDEVCWISSFWCA